MSFFRSLMEGFPLFVIRSVCRTWDLRKYSSICLLMDGSLFSSERWKTSETQELANLPDHLPRLVSVSLGVDLCRECGRVAQDNPGHLDSVAAAKPSRGRVA